MHTLLVPVVKDAAASAPIATLLSPVVSSCNADDPTAGVYS